MHAAPLAGARSEVYDLVVRAPGATPADVARALAVDHSTATYHLRRLAKARLIVPQAGGRHVRYYAAGCGLCPFLREALPVLRDERYAALLAAIEGAPATVVDLVGDAPPGRVRARLDRLRGLGLVRLAGGRWAPTPETATCRERARGDGACGLWGRCAVSLRGQATASPPDT